MLSVVTHIIYRVSFSESAKKRTLAGYLLKRKRKSYKYRIAAVKKKTESCFFFKVCKQKEGEVASSSINPPIRSVFEQKKL